VTPTKSNSNHHLFYKTIKYILILNGGVKFSFE